MRNYSLIFIVPIFILFGCSSAPKPEITSGLDDCEKCGMVIDRVNQACGYFLENEFITFDAPTCMLNALDEIKTSGQPIPEQIFLFDYNDGESVPADSAVFLLTEHIPTVMMSNTLCFRDRMSAEKLREYDDEIVTDWIGFRTLRGEPDVRINVTLTPQGMIPEVIVLQKGEIAEWEVSFTDFPPGEKFSIKGYDNIKPIIVPAEEQKVAFRMMADKPGSGFPIFRHTDDKPLGILKVMGAHTKDEQEM